MIETWEESYDRVRNEIDKFTENLDIKVRYSAFAKDKNGNLVNNLKEVAIEGKVIICQPADDFFGGEASKPYNSRILTNPTWLTLFKHSARAMQRTLDEHHCFFEGFDIIGKHDGVTIIELSMGS